MLQNGELVLKNRLLSKDDFYWLSHIIENLFKTQTFESRLEAQNVRVSIIQTSGIESAEYLEVLHDYVSGSFEESYASTKQKVYKKADKTPDLYDTSEAEHIGVGEIAFTENEEIRK